MVPAPRVQVFPRNGMDLPFQIQTYSSVLGAQTESLTRQLGEYFGVKDGEGVLVRSVEKGSAAEKAGLKAGDVIVKADNEKLTDRSDLSHILCKMSFQIGNVASQQIVDEFTALFTAPRLNNPKAGN